MKIFWDAKKIIEDMDAISYAKSKNIPLQQIGNQYYIFCPEHKEQLGKIDKKIGNCKLRKQGYYCFSCKAKGNGIKLDMMQFGHTFPEACEEIATWLGDNDLYAEKGKCEEASFNVSLPITEEELIALGLYKAVTVKYPKQASVYKDDFADKNTDFYREKNIYIDYLGEERFLYIESKEHFVEISTLFYENYSAFCEMIWGKSIEMIDIYKKIIEFDYVSIFFQKKKIQQEIETYIYNQYVICVKILTKFGYTYTGTAPILVHTKKISRFVCT